MNIIPDPVLVVVQMVPFLALMLGLHVILFKPMLAYLDERAHATAGARHEADKLSAATTALVTRWETAIAAAQSEIADLRAQRRAAANAEYQRVVSDARRAAEARIADAAIVIRNDAARAREELRASSRTLAGDVVRQVLGRPADFQLEA
jgi:F-type H+-transporting ATPase subunit b